MKQREAERRHRAQKEIEYAQQMGGDALDKFRVPQQQRPPAPQAVPMPTGQSPQGSPYEGYGMVEMAYNAPVNNARQLLPPPGAPPYGGGPPPPPRPNHPAAPPRGQPQQGPANEEMAYQLNIAHNEIARLRAHNAKLSKALKAVGLWAAQADLD